MILVEKLAFSKDLPEACVIALVRVFFFLTALTILTYINWIHDMF